MIELPLTRIKENPRQTFFNAAGPIDGGFPKKTPAATVLDKAPSNKKGSFAGRKRSMSASSANSNRSFRSTRKRPGHSLDGPAERDGGKFGRPSGAKFLKALSLSKQKLAANNEQSLSKDLHHLEQDKSQQHKYLKNFHLIQQSRATADLIRQLDASELSIDGAMAGTDRRRTPEPEPMLIDDTDMTFRSVKASGRGPPAV